MKSKSKVLVSDWKRAYRWLSVQIMALIAAGQSLFIFMPTVKDYIPPTIWHVSMGVLAGLAILARLINQTPPDKS